MLRSEPFRWGASLALLPALLGLPAASYAGMAAANMMWHLMFGSDAPAPAYFIGGLLYGITFGVLLQCFLFGLAGRLGWQISSRRLAPLLSRASRSTKLVLWVGAEVVVVPISFYMTTMAYGGPALLSWLFGIGR